MSRLRWVLLAVVLAVAVAVSFVSFDRPEPQASGSAPASRPIRLAVVGDSLSAGASKYLGNGLDDGTWITSAVDDDIEFVGGWARSGATPDRMAEHVRPVRDVDVLVILAGTNAVRLGKSLHEEAAAYRSIVATIHPRSVLVTAIPPYVWKPTDAERYNRQLETFARSEGWDWGDPWGFARDGAGWAAGVSRDGTHPAGPAQYRELGLAMRGLIERAATDETITRASR